MVTQRAYLSSVCSPEPCCMDAQAALRPAAARECVWIGHWARLNETQNVHRSQYLRPYATNRGDQGTSLQCSAKLPRCTGPHFCLLLDTAMCWAILDGGFPCPWGPAISNYNLSHLPLRKAHMVTRRAYLRSVCSPEPCCMEAQAALSQRLCLCIGHWASLNESQNVCRSLFLILTAPIICETASLQCSVKLWQCSGLCFLSEWLQCGCVHEVPAHDDLPPQNTIWAISLSGKPIWWHRGHIWGRSAALSHVALTLKQLCGQQQPVCVWIGPWARLNETQNVHRSQYLRPYATNRGDQGTSLQCSGKLPRCTGPHFCLLLDTAMSWAILDGGFPCPWGPAI